MTGANHDLAAALVDIYEGNDDVARPLLTPLAQANPLGDAAVELGLLELRHGRRDEAYARLNAIASNRKFDAPDDYFRLARAAAGAPRVPARRATPTTASWAKRRAPTSRPTSRDMFLDARAAAATRSTCTKPRSKADPDWVPAQVGLAQGVCRRRSEAGAGRIRRREEARAGQAGRLDAGRASARSRTRTSPAAAEALDKVKTARPAHRWTKPRCASRSRTSTAAPPKSKRRWPASKRSTRDPRAGGSRRGDQASHNYRFDDAVDVRPQGRALDPGGSHDAHGDLGMYLHAHRRRGEARTVLERVVGSRQEQSPDEEHARRARSARQVRGRQRRPDRLQVRQEGSRRSSAVRAAARAKRRTRRSRSDTASRRKGPILVEIFPEHDDFAVRTIGLPGIDGALGACFGRVVVDGLADARVSPGEFSWHATEWHELAHVFTLQLSNYRVPRWLTEGISVFEEYRRRSGVGPRADAGVRGRARRRAHVRRSRA